MDFSAFENFLFTISSETGKTAILYELHKSTAFKKNSFVVLPYQNPQTGILAPEYYDVKNKAGVFISDLPEPTGEQTPITLKAVTTKAAYIKKVSDLKDQIRKGNIYEINYCIRFVSENTVLDPFPVFIKLQELAKAPYAALVKLGENYIICASPELFLEKKGEVLHTKPIKGTIKRGKTTEEDEALKNSLYTSLKERTENVMAVDVARNDLSRFAKKGTVHVNKLYNIETFETVHQMVSTVSCEIKENTSFTEIIDATFPMASMTGAPKLRAMELIDAHEDFTRHYYSGAMGLVDEQEDFTLSVIIRSIFYNQRTQEVSICVGGAITYLSDPEKEYEECLLKANALLKALNATIN